MPQVKEYLSYFRRQSHPSLFRADLELDDIERRYGDIETREVIYQICLNREERGMELSIRVDAPDAPYWLALDEAVDRPPRRFFDAAFRPLAGDERAERLRPMLERVLALTEGRCAGLRQVGVVSGQGGDGGLRVFTEAMPKDAATALLRDLNWRGDLALLDDYLARWDACCRQDRVILDFELLPDGVSERIGVSIGPKSKLPQKTDAFLRLLEEEGLCRAEKARGIEAWVRFSPQCEPFLQNDISHFKFSFDLSGIREAKAYLRQKNTGSWAGYRYFFRPVQMNLELTTRCPLHCPQCYVSLNTGKELPLDTALYWLRQAAEYGVSQINLSGGETMCYPHLNELIRECRRLSLRSAVALSGAYVTEETLREMIDAGVNEIYVSLNGSTEEINARTRDGYALAVRTLELLQRLDFSERFVNWVMHSTNAEDLPGMLALCERYGVKGLIVLGFKPDSSHALRSFPTAAQMREAAKTIRSYSGSVTVDVEPCFSQLRALVHSGFLMNSNIGVQRGCGAGRDGVSVSVDGQLTPCRHLETAETVSTLAEYWENSPFLRRLREVEDHRDAPCKGCTYERNCLPCMAVGTKLHGELNYGMKECPLAAANG